MDNENKPDSQKNASPQVKKHPTIFLNHHRHFHMARSAVITIILFIFLAILPPFIRIALFRGILVHPYLATMLFCFSLIALSLLWSTGQHIDALIFLYFNLRGKRPLWLDRVMLGFTQLGNGLFGLIVALIFFGVNNNRLAYELILGTLSLWLLVDVVKVLVHRSRPYIKLTQTRVVGHLEHGRSFPSGHTSQIFFMVTLLVKNIGMNIWVAIFLFTLAVLVAVTRMYVGAHYPRDVLAGVMLGSVWGILGIIIDSHFLVGG
jgi:membrane-associated phospholipid phosphatase